MNQSEFYETSLNLFTQRAENRLKNDDEDLLFNWMLTLFNFIFGFMSASNEYDIQFKGAQAQNYFGLKFSAVSVIYLCNIKSYEEFCKVIYKMASIINQNPHYTATYYCPESAEDIKKLYFNIIFSLHVNTD